jgi:hypothetical protein
MQAKNVTDKIEGIIYFSMDSTLALKQLIIQANRISSIINIRRGAM